MEHEAIKSSFLNFYESLYQKLKVKKENIGNYLQGLYIPELSPTLRDELNKEIEDAEILEEINMSKKGKTPGLDGFTTLFY